MSQPKLKQLNSVDHAGAIAEALFIANLMFVGVVYIILCIFYLVKYKDASPVSKNHLKQTLVAGAISTLIVVLFNVIVVLTTGYASATALIMAEVYLMLIVPLFMVVGIFGFTRAINADNYRYPLVGNLLGIEKGK